MKAVIRVLPLIPVLNTINDDDDDLIAKLKEEIDFYAENDMPDEAAARMNRLFQIGAGKVAINIVREARQAIDEQLQPA